ncbi:MAG: hypothetical protein K6F15_08255 [Treponema sp.]|nr:hypothetical protein [Treponema sp.]
MIEIELKAHVYDRKSLIEKLNTFAKYEQTVDRHDLYYHIPVARKENQKPYLTARIRKEIKHDQNGNSETIYLTYKKKEVSENAIEVNIEKESIIQDEKVLISLFTDAGFTLAHVKDKHVEDYYLETEFGKASLELCTVGPLGDFLEIEILSQTDDRERISKIQKELKNLLAKAGIPEDCIEKKYYTQMLSEYEEAAKAKNLTSE